MIRFRKDDGSEYPEWKQKSLNEICNIIGGGTPNTDIKEYWNGTIPWFTPSEIGINKYVESSKRKITELGLKKSSAKLLPAKTILLSTRATLGEMSICNINCATNQGFQSLIVNKDNYIEYIYYLQSIIKKYCFSHASGSTFLEIKKSELEKCIVPLPCLEEQQKIADFLSSVDDAINATARELELLKLEKKSLMQKIFTREIRFLDEDGREYPEWKTYKLKNVVDIYDGTHQTPDYKDTGIPFVSVENIKNIEKTTKFISEEAFRKEFKIFPEYGDILMTRIGDIGTSNIVKVNYPIAYYVSLALFKCQKINNEFLNQYIKCPNFQNELWFKTLHIAFPKKINKGDIGECKVLVPCPEEQQKIATFLSSVDDAIDATTKELNHWKDLKKGLLQQIFM